MTDYYNAIIGHMQLTFTEKGCRSISFVKDQPTPNSKTHAVNTHTHAEAYHHWLTAYCAGTSLPVTQLKMDLQGTDFQRRIWLHLAQIPFGQVITYGDLSKETATGSAQAIGQAVGKNPLAIVLPCHRVIAAHRRLGGFASGLKRKQRLLIHEGHQMRKPSKRDSLSQNKNGSEKGQIIYV